MPHSQSLFYSVKCSLNRSHQNHSFNAHLVLLFMINDDLLHLLLIAEWMTIIVSLHQQSDLTQHFLILWMLQNGFRKIADPLYRHREDYAIELQVKVLRCLCSVFLHAIAASKSGLAGSASLHNALVGHRALFVKTIKEGLWSDDLRLRRIISVSR